MRRAGAGWQRAAWHPLSLRGWPAAVPPCTVCKLPALTPSLPPPLSIACSFAVLVAGTVAYGRGDEAAAASRDVERRLASVRPLASSGSRSASAAELKLLRLEEEQV